MSLAKLMLVTCDVVSCDEHVYRSESHENAVRRELFKRGWRTRTVLPSSPVRVDFCPQHAEHAARVSS